VARNVLCRGFSESIKAWTEAGDFQSDRRTAATGKMAMEIVDLPAIKYENM
jgi:hypothetical protein